jgi:hypothetical protein
VGERHRLSDPVPERLGSLTVGLLKSARYFEQWRTGATKGRTLEA